MPGNNYFTESVMAPAKKLTQPTGKKVKAVNNRGAGSRVEFKPRPEGKLPGDSNPWPKPKAASA